MENKTSGEVWANHLRPTWKWVFIWIMKVSGIWWWWFDLVPSFNIPESPHTSNSHGFPVYTQYPNVPGEKILWKGHFKVHRVYKAWVHPTDPLSLQSSHQQPLLSFNCHGAELLQEAIDIIYSHYNRGEDLLPALTSVHSAPTFILSMFISASSMLNSMLSALPSDAHSGVTSMCSAFLPSRPNTSDGTTVQHGCDSGREYCAALPGDPWPLLGHRVHLVLQ